MENQLNPYEARIIGVLIEKSFTTPDQYPLSLNATTNACNQKSCRNPVVDYTEAEVLITLKGLRMKQLGGGSIPANSRVERWHHSAREHWKLPDVALAAFSELLLRGPQSASALRSNANRMTPIANAEALEAGLEPLRTAQLLRTIPPGSGSRVMLYALTLGAAPQSEKPSDSPSPEAPVHRPQQDADAAPAASMEALESRVATLEKQLADLAEKLGETL